MFVYTIQPVVKTVIKNRFDNRLDVCLHDTAGCPTNWLYNRLYRVDGVLVVLFRFGKLSVSSHTSKW